MFCWRMHYYGGIYRILCTGSFFLLIGFFIVLFVHGPVVAQEPLEDVQVICPLVEHTVVGNTILVKDTEQTFTVRTTEDTGLSFSSTFRLMQGEELIATNTGMIFTHFFDGLGEYILYTERVWSGSSDCTYTMQTPIDVYASLITYIGPSSEEVQLSHEGLGVSGTTIYQIIVEDIATMRPDQLTTLFAERAYYLQHADTLLVDGDVFGPLFDVLGTLQQLVDLQVADADLYVLASINQSAFRRIMAKYRDLLGMESISVVSRQYIGSLLTSLLLHKNTDQLSFVKTYNIGLVSGNKFLLISYLVDYLLYNNFPIGALIFILLLPFLVVISSILRQVIGLSVFGVFYPLLFAFSLHIVGISPTIIFFIAAFITTTLLGVFTKHIYLLYSPKVALMIVLYCLVTLLCLWGAHSIDPTWIDFGLFQNYYFLFPFLILLMVGNRVFTEQFYLFDAGWWIGVLEFVFVSLIMYWAISSQYIQNTLLGLPEISLVCILLIVIVGRFTGLQIMEYFRFMPLIKYYFDTEEEE